MGYEVNYIKQTIYFYIGKVFNKAFISKIWIPVYSILIVIKKYTLYLKICF